MATAFAGQNGAGTAAENIEFADPDDDTYGMIDPPEDGDGTVKEPTKARKSLASAPVKAPKATVKAVPEPAKTAKPPEPKPQGDEPTEPAGEADEFTDDLLRQADHFGFTDAEARAFGSADLLEKNLAALDRRAARELAAKQQADAAAKGTPPAEVKADAAVAKQTTAAAAAIEKLKLELADGEWSEEGVKILNKLNDHYHSAAEASIRAGTEAQTKVALLEKQLQQITGRFQAEDAARYVEGMDRFFDSLGEGFVEVFGKGPMRAFNPKSAESIARNEIADQMTALAQADAFAGRRMRDLDDLARAAVRVLHGDKLKSQARAEVAAEVTKRGRQAVSRPTQVAKDAKLTPTQKAAQRAKEFYRDHDLEDETYDVI